VLDTAPLQSAPRSRDAGQEHGVPGDRPTASDHRLPLERTRLIPVSDIESAGPLDSAGLRVLFESILQWGILQPLIVRPTAGGRYEVLVGRKRFAAARSAGFAEVPCVLFEGSEADAAALAAASNTVNDPGRSPAPPINAPHEGTAAVLGELQTIRETISRMLALDGARPDGLRQRVARELLAAELQRASWIVDALLVFQAPPEASRGPVRLAPLLRGALEPFQPECRLGGIEVRVIVEPGNLALEPFQPECRPGGHEVRVLVEPENLALAAGEWPVRCALNCLIGAVLASMQGAAVPNPELVIRVSAVGGMGVVSLSQNVVPLHTLVRLRTGVRGGNVPSGEALLASFAFEAARRTAEGAGGRIELRVDTGEAGGSVDLKFPAAPP
jgi:hypothetical protein